MPEGARKQELLQALKTNQAEWEELLAKVGMQRMTEAGVTGDWSVKDIIAHLNAWEERAALWTEAVRKGAPPPRPPWAPNLSEDETNAAIYEMNRGRPLDEVLSQARETRRRLTEGLGALTEEEISERAYDWLGNNTLAGSLAGNSFDHYRDHAELIRAWLDKQPVSTTQ